MARPHPNEDLSAYLDGELTDAEVAELEAELARDPDLRAELDELEGVVQWLREEGPDAAPLGFHARVMARIEEEHPVRPSVWAWLRRPFGFPLEGWLVAAAAAAVLAFVLLPKGGDGVGTDAWSDPPTDAETSPAAVKIPAPDTTGKTDPPSPAPPGEGDVQQAAPPAERPVPKKSAPAPAPVAPAPTPGPAPAVPAPPTAVTSEAPDPGTGDVEPMASPGYRYVLRSTDPDMKLALLRLAGRYGGATTPGGSEVADSQMDASAEELLVRVPVGDLTRFAEELSGLGYELVKEPSTEIVRGTTIPVSITLQLIGGATTEPRGKPNAASKQRKGLDFADEMLEAAEDP